MAILRCAKTKALGGPHIHEVYIDECQDNQIVDLALILKVFDHADSYFFAGDVAQCIAQGSSFRFQGMYIILIYIFNNLYFNNFNIDLRALIYRWELTRIQFNHNQRNKKSNQFNLNINYRCHNGILQLAASVVDLVTDFFS